MRYSALLRGTVDDGEHVVFFHDEQVLAVEPDLLAGVLAEEHLIAGLDVERHDLAVLRDPPVAGGDDRAPLRLLLGAVRDDDAADLLLAIVETVDDDAIVQGSNVHEVLQAVLTGTGG